MSMRLITASEFREKALHYRELAELSGDLEMVQLYRDFADLLADEAAARERVGDPDIDRLGF